MFQRQIRRFGQYDPVLAAERSTQAAGEAENLFYGFLNLWTWIRLGTVEQDARRKIPVYGMDEDDEGQTIRSSTEATPVRRLGALEMGLVNIL